MTEGFLQLMTSASRPRHKRIYHASRVVFKPVSLRIASRFKRKVAHANVSAFCRSKLKHFLRETFRRDFAKSFLEFDSNSLPSIFLCRHQGRPDTSEWI